MPVAWASGIIMRTTVLAAAMLLGCSVLSGCGAQGPSGRLAEAAVQSNVAMRFGRMDVALANVDKKKHSTFAEKHADWGRGIRIVDLEVGGFSFLTADHADVYVTVAWQRPAEAELRVTQVTQRWYNGDDGWKLLFEETRGGNAGLFGEPIPEEEAPSEPEAPKRTQFPTHVIAAQ
jgi:hypothetical protein